MSAIDPAGQRAAAKGKADCGSHSCLYAARKTGMRTNGRCRCDACPTCPARLTPGGPQSQHLDWCPNQDWVPERYRLALGAVAQ